MMQYHRNSSIEFKLTCPQRVKYHDPTMLSNVCLQDSLEFNSSRSKGQVSSKLHPLRSNWPKRVPQRRCLVWCNCWRARWTWTNDKWWKVMETMIIGCLCCVFLGKCLILERLKQLLEHLKQPHWSLIFHYFEHTCITWMSISYQ